MISDKALEDLDVRPGDIIKITRKSPTAGESVYYRYVVEGRQNNDREFYRDVAIISDILRREGVARAASEFITTLWSGAPEV